MNSHTKEQEPHALNLPKPLAALLRPTKYWVYCTRLSVTPIHRLTYKNTYPKDTQEIAEAFGRIFALSPTTDSNLRISYRPCLTSEVFSGVSFLPKGMASLVEKTNVIYHIGPDLLSQALFTLGEGIFQCCSQECSTSPSDEKTFSSQRKASIIIRITKKCTGLHPANYIDHPHPQRP